MHRPQISEPTLGELHVAPHWTWAHCRNALTCRHKAPMPFAPLVIRFGCDAPRSKIVRSLVCSVCGTRGADLSHPSWGDMLTGWQPFPTDRATVFSHPA